LKSDENLLDKIRKLMRSSNIDPYQIFNSADPFNVGKITNM